MPTYEYICTDCAEPVEAYQSFTDPPLEVCEKCGGRLRRVFSPVGISFKGTGFYSTDARAAKQKAKRDSAKSDSGKSDSGKSDTGGSKDKTSQGDSNKSSNNDKRPAESGRSSTPARSEKSA